MKRIFCALLAAAMLLLPCMALADVILEPEDSFYRDRREHGAVVSLACQEPEETCFCQAFGVDPAQPQGDVSCWMDAKALYWQANTEKGEALTAKLSMLEDAGDEAVIATLAS